MPFSELRKTKQPLSQRSQQSNVHFPISSVPVMTLTTLLTVNSVIWKKKNVQEKVQDNTNSYLGNTEDYYVSENADHQNKW